MLMARLQPERLPAQQRPCERHGAYLAEHLFGERWARCPECAQEFEKKQQAREAERKRIEAQNRAAAELAYRLRISGLVGRFERATFENFATELPGKAAALQTCRDFAKAFTPDGSGGLWLIGPPGTGKTHLGSAIVSHAIRERLETASIHAVHEIMRMLRERFGKKEARAWEDDFETSDELIHRLGSQPLLVLDEIGVSRDSEWQREQLFAIVDERYRLERPTIVISNLTAADLKSVLGDRVYDRLREGASIVPMNWPSHRGSRA